MCDILGLKNVTEALRGLDDDEKDKIRISEVMSNGVERQRKMWIINEPGLYQLVIRSTKPEAKVFARPGEIIYRVYPTQHGYVYQEDRLTRLDQ